jgi:hypothetical protein
MEMENLHGMLVLRAENYTVAESFTLRWIQPSLEFDAGMEVVIMLRDKTAPSKRLRLVCHDVVALTLCHQLDYNHGLGYVMVYDISKFWYLDCRYRIMESEGEGFDFYCKDIEIIEESA